MMNRQIFDEEPIEDWMFPQAGSMPLLMGDLSDHFYRIMWDILSAPGKTKKGKRADFTAVVASCNHGEGASTIALNIASAFAVNSVKSVVLIDANLRTPILHDYFGVNREPGLTDLVSGDVGLEDAIVEVTSPRFHFISAGYPVRNPVLAFEGAPFLAVMNRLKSSYDLIIFDSSPLIPYPETSILGSEADGLILVLEAEETRWEVGQAAKSNLEASGVNVVGAVLNKREYYIPASIYKYL